MSYPLGTIFNFSVEGDTDVYLIRRLLLAKGLSHDRFVIREDGGKQNLLTRLPNYNRAARSIPWIVLVDLDRDAACAPDYLRRCVPHPSEHLHFNIAVRAIESWLIADRERLSEFLHVAVSKIPQRPEEIESPKRKLVELASQSRLLAIREDMVPRPGSGRTIGPAYSSRIKEFVGRPDCPWRADVASVLSPSLGRFVRLLDSFVR